MSSLTLSLLALGLAVDAFAVAVGTSIALAGVSRRQVFRLAFHFGLFQALMPVLGWFGGRHLSAAFSSWDHWLAFALLAYVGVHTIYSALTAAHGRPRRDPTRGRSLVLLSIATSLDALAVGVSLGLLELDIWKPALVIGCVAATLTTVGMLVGGRLGAPFGRGAAVCGGLVLLGIGVKILLMG